MLTQTRGGTVELHRKNLGTHNLGLAPSFSSEVTKWNESNQVNQSQDASLKQVLPGELPHQHDRHLPLPPAQVAYQEF